MAQRTRPPETTTIRVANVYEGEALIDGPDGGELACTADAIRFEGHDGQRLAIAHDEITCTRVDLDRSVSGFGVLRNVFGIATVAMGLACALAVWTLGPVLSVVTLTPGLSAVFALGATVWMHRLRVGVRTVLQVDYGDGERVRFVTDGECEAFDEVAARVAE